MSDKKTGKIIRPKPLCHINWKNKRGNIKEKLPLSATIHIVSYAREYRKLIAIFFFSDTAASQRKTSQATNPVRPEAFRTAVNHRKASSWHFRCSFQPLLGHSVIRIEQKACVDDVIPEYRAKRASETCFFVILLTSKPCLRQKRHREFQKAGSRCVFLVNLRIASAKLT